MDKQYKTAKCNIYTKDEAIFLKLEMPGVDKDRLNIVVEGDLLKISGKREETNITGDFLVKEINDRDYYQEYTLDETIDTEKITATCNNGIVLIELGLRESKKPRKIEIG